ncbi:MAG: arylesterase [Bryobacteraceae bacterium]
MRASRCLLVIAVCALQSAVPAAKPGGRPVIVAFGDSLTAGFGAEPGYSYPDFLQKELDRRGLRWRVVNAGISGDTTTDGMNRVRDVLSYRPAIVILEFGGNDGLRGLPLETTQANLDRIIAGLLKDGARVILAGMTLPPNYGSDYIRPFEKMYVDLAAKYKLPRIQFLLEGVGGNAKLMQRDGLHPTAQGNSIVARNVFATLEPLLKAVKKPTASAVLPRVAQAFLPVSHLDQDPDVFNPVFCPAAGQRNTKGHPCRWNFATSALRS